MLKKKKDGRRSAEKMAKENKLKKRRHWLDCKECETNGAEVDGTVKAFICWRCTASMCAAPDDLKPAKKYAQYKGSFPHGWWRRIIFSGEHDDKTLYFSRGNEITKAEFRKLEKARAQA